MAKSTSKHAFGSEANVDSAIARGLIDAYDVLFLDEKKIGWIDANGKKVIIDKQIKHVSVLPSVGTMETLYICDSVLYFWDGKKFVPVMTSGDNGGISEAVVDAKIKIANAEVKQYADNAVKAATSIIDENENQTPLAVKTILADNINDVEKKDGQLIFVRDQHQIALDYNNTRTLYSGVIELYSDYARLTLKTPIVGATYFVTTTNIWWLYRKSGWQKLTVSASDVVSIVTEYPVYGDPNLLYVNKMTREVAVWDNALSNYLIVGNVGYSTGGGGTGGNSGSIDTTYLERIMIAKGEAIEAAQADATEKAAAAQQIAMSYTDDRVNPLSEQIAGNSANINNMTNNITTLNSLVASHDADIDDLNKKIATLEEEGVVIEEITNEEIDAFFA